MKKFRKVIPIIIAFIIGLSTTVGAATVFNSKDITYSSDKTTKTNVKDSLDELYTKANTPWKCASGYYCYTTFCPTGYVKGTNAEGYPICTGTKSISEVQVGNYISMTPTATSYTISKDLTGWTRDQTINPSELKLWKVIKKNSDGTIEVISEYVSSTQVYFMEWTGYMNLVGGLNQIAAQYTNAKYVSKTRHYGYSNQLEFCTEQSIAACPGDSGWETDNRLVGSSMRTNPSGVASTYWVASRYTYSGYYSCYVVNTQKNGLSEGGKLRSPVYASILPILTLKSTVQIKSGTGTSSAPYQLS